MKLSECFTGLGSDKCTDHSYGPFYDELTETRQISSVLEIGVLKGASIRAWSLFNPKIQILGVDRDLVPGLNMIRAVTPGYLPVIEHCRKFKLKFDLIIDDGSHIELDQVHGKQCLWEFLKPGGIYVVEDVQSHEIAERMRILHGARIINLMKEKGRWDDVLAVWEKPRE